MNKHLGLLILRLSLGLVVGGYSAALALHQLHGRLHWALLLLGLAEFVAAILFLIPATVRLGGIALLVIFGGAAVLHFLSHDYNVAYLAVYGAAAFAVISDPGVTHERR